MVGRFESQGGKKIVFVPVNTLEMTGCNWHPSIADDVTISKALIEAIDEQS